MPYVCDLVSFYIIDSSMKVLWKAQPVAGTAVNKSTAHT